MKGYIVCILFPLLSLAKFSDAQFNVVGYVPPSKSIAKDIGKIAFSKLTHLNIAFVNPDSSGNLLTPFGFDTLILKAHQYEIKVLASIGGGSHNPYYARLLSDSNRRGLVNRLLRLVEDHDLDGIDVDLEGDAIDSNYEPFIIELSTALKPINKLLTAALATWNAEKITDAALEKFDFINVMSYDQTGPWRRDKPGPHSTIVKAEEDLDLWITQRRFPKEKTNLGLPFYGYCFNTKYGESMTYAEIISTFKGADRTDIVMPEGGGAIYYNGLPTIQHKTRMALKTAGGVMIWQLLQDADGNNSLLDAIHKIVQQKQ